MAQSLNLTQSGIIDLSLARVLRVEQKNIMGQILARRLGQNPLVWQTIHQKYRLEIWFRENPADPQNPIQEKSLVLLGIGSLKENQSQPDACLEDRTQQHLLKSPRY